MNIDIRIEFITLKMYYCRLFVEPEVLHPSSFPSTAVNLLGFDPASERKKLYMEVINSLPTPKLGKNLDPKDSVHLSIIEKNGN